MDSDKGASESPGAAQSRGGVQGPGASGQAVPAAVDNTTKRKQRTALHHKLLEFLCPALHQSVCMDARCSHHVLDDKKMSLDLSLQV